MRYKIFSILFVLIILSTFVFAETSYVFKQNTPASISIPVFENDLSRCISCDCNVTINYPNGTLAVQNVPMVLTTNYAQYDFNNTQELGIYLGDIYCSNGANYGSSSFSIEITPTGREAPSGSLQTFFIILFLLILGVMTYLFGYSMGHFIKKDFDVLDLAFDWGLFFVLLGFYFLEGQYMGNPLIDSILNVLIYVGGFTHVFCPALFFVISLIWNSMDTNRRRSEGKTI